jgi:bifunctional non-homologous end joining protein LigD
MSNRMLPIGFIPPCLPTKASTPPSGALWLHEIKHDGFRVIARKDGTKVRLYSRPGNDLTYRFPLIAETVAGLPSRSCVIDGEAVACGDDVDLIELDGADLRREPLEVRKATLVSVRQRPSAAFG